MPLTFIEVKDALSQSKNPNYVPKIDWFDLGKCAFWYGLEIADGWRSAIVDGFEFEVRKCFGGIAKDDIASAMAFVDAMG